MLSKSGIPGGAAEGGLETDRQDYTEEGKGDVGERGRELERERCKMYMKLCLFKPLHTHIVVV